MKKILFWILTFLWIWLSFCNAQILVEDEPLYSIYHNSELWLISVYDWTNWITLQDKNLWAENLNDYWYYYQRWNNYWFQWWTNTSQTMYSFESYVWINYFSLASFCTRKDWCFYQNTTPVWNAFKNAWWDGWDSSRRKWPCWGWFHVPLVSEFQFLINIWLNVSDFNSIFYIPLPWYIDYGWVKFSQGSNYSLWTSQYNTNSANTRYFSSLNWSSSSYSLWNSLASRWLSVRCFSDEFVVPDSSWSLVYWNSQTFPSSWCPDQSINVYYNNWNSSWTIICDWTQAIEINWLSTITSTNTRTPYFNINYRDEDNQLLTESYSKDILYLKNWLFKKTYTWNNERILSYNWSESNFFTWYVPTFDIVFTGDTWEDTWNVFNNFAQNSLQVVLSNIPSYIQYVIIIMLLFFILGLARRKKRR